MTKKSQLDERIDTLFAGINPEEGTTKSKRASGIDVLAPHSIHPVPDRQNYIPNRKKLLIPVGIMSVCLLTGFFVFSRFQTAFTAASPAQLVPAPTSPILPDAPVSTNTQTQDIQPPSVPGKLTATITDAATVNLIWAASSDNLGVVGYTIYRNGIPIATTSDPGLTFRDEATTPDTAYDYAIDAYDQSGNHSAISALLRVTTPAQPGDQIFLLPSEDTYVNATSPESIYGTADTLRVDGNPDIHAYLRFFVTGLKGKTIARARLMLYTNSDAVRGIQIRAVIGNIWNELGTQYHNAPALGDQLASSKAADSATWIELDITAYVTGEGRYNFGIVTDSTTAVHLASRETGADAPKLVLDLR